MMPRTFEQDGVLFDRVTIKFVGGRHAPHARAFLQPALILAHSLRTAGRHIDALAKRGDRFRVAIARRAVKPVRHCLAPLVQIGLIGRYVATHRARVAG